MEEASGKVLIVRSGTELYALDMTVVREVVYEPDITFLARHSGFIAGMCLWRDTQVPVADLGLFLGKVQPAGTGSVVITVNNGETTGILVEEVGSIVDIQPASLIVVDNHLSRDDERVSQAFEYRDELVFIIESKAVIGSQPH